VESASLVQTILTNVENVEKKWHRKVMKSIVDAAVAIATKQLEEITFMLV